MSKEIRYLQAELAKNTNDNALNRIKPNYKIPRSLCLPLDQRSIWPLISNSQSIFDILLRDSDIQTIMDTPEPKMPRSQPKATFFASGHDLHLYQESRPPALICLSSDICTGTIRTQRPAPGLDGTEPGIEETSLETGLVLEHRCPYPDRPPGSMVQIATASYPTIVDSFRCLADRTVVGSVRVTPVHQARRYTLGQYQYPWTSADSSETLQLHSSPAVIATRRYCGIQYIETVNLY